MGGMRVMSFSQRVDTSTTIDVIISVKETEHMSTTGATMPKETRRAKD